MITLDYRQARDTLLWWEKDPNICVGSSIFAFSALSHFPAGRCGFLSFTKRPCCCFFFCWWFVSFSFLLLLSLDGCHGTWSVPHATIKFFWHIFFFLSILITRTIVHFSCALELDVVARPFFSCWASLGDHSMSDRCPLPSDFLFPFFCSCCMAHWNS